MNWRPYLQERLDRTYRVVDDLVDLLATDDLDWKPATGSNWMTVGQLLEHLAGCGGRTFRYLSDGKAATRTDESAGELPLADALPSVKSLEEGRSRIAADRDAALAALAALSDEELEVRPCPLWWDPREVSLGQRLSEMVDHLVQHKGQLFYYLKLMGRRVDTSLLWGM